MFELAGLTTAFFVIGALVVVALVSLAAPIAWVWMLIDAILRDDAEYPGSSANTRLIWVLLMVLLPISAVAYFFLVYARKKRGAAEVDRSYAEQGQPTATVSQAQVSAG